MKGFGLGTISFAIFLDVTGGIDSDRVGRWILVTAQFKIFAIQFE